MLFASPELLAELHYIDLTRDNTSFSLWWIVTSSNFLSSQHGGRLAHRMVGAAD